MTAQRLTKEWTPTLMEAFGNKPSIVRAREAELLVLDTFEGWGYDVIDHESNKHNQVRGIDIEIKHPTWKNFYSMDVKANMNKYGSFYVETTPDGWLRSPKKVSDRICHVCNETKWIAWYSRQDMIKWLRDNGYLRTKLLEITTRHKLPFIAKRKVG